MITPESPNSTKDNSGVGETRQSGFLEAVDNKILFTLLKSSLKLNLNFTSMRRMGNRETLQNCALHNVSFGMRTKTLSLVLILTESKPIDNTSPCISFTVT